MLSLNKGLSNSRYNEDVAVETAVEVEAWSVTSYLIKAFETLPVVKQIMELQSYVPEERNELKRVLRKTGLSTRVIDRAIDKLEAYASKRIIELALAF